MRMEREEAPASPLSPRFLLVVLLLSLFLSLYVPLTVGDQHFVTEPQDQTAVAGSRVVLPCRVANMTGALQWTMDDFGLGTHRNLSAFERHRMIGSDEEGNFSLEISPVLLDDEGRYQCQVSVGSQGEPALRSRYANLTVVAPPDPPLIIQGDFLVATEGRQIQLECVSHSEYSAAQIIWYDGYGKEITGLEEDVEILRDGRRFITKSIFKLTPKKENHNTTFTCQSLNPAGHTIQSAKIHLEVKYAPKVTLSVLSQHITEGAEVCLVCHADANPLDLKYQWFINDVLMVGDFTTELVISNITRHYNNAIVKCEVQNPIGKGKALKILDIYYDPRFKTAPKKVQADEGMTITLTCDVDGRPPPYILWIHKDTGKVVGLNVNLTLKVIKQTAGTYLCRAQEQGFDVVVTEVTVFLKGKPTIRSELIQFGVPGNTVHLECLAFSVPKPQKIIWIFKGKQISAFDKKFIISEEHFPEGMKSTLVIRESRDQHFGFYNCTAVNTYGSGTVDILLKAQKTSPSLMIIVGVIGVIIIVIIIIVMIIILHKRKEMKRRDCIHAANDFEDYILSFNINDSFENQIDELQIENTSFL